MPEKMSILLVEDLEDDILLIRRAFAAAKLTTPLYVVRDGEEAIEYLSGTGAYGDRQAHPLPSLVLLDVKLPRRSGLEVLLWLRARDDLRVGKIVVGWRNAKAPSEIIDG